MLHSATVRELNLTDLCSQPVLGRLPTLTRLRIGTVSGQPVCWDGLAGLTSLQVSPGRVARCLCMIRFLCTRRICGSCNGTRCTRRSGELCCSLQREQIVHVSAHRT